MAIHYKQAQEGEDALIAEINTTPLVDVLLVLLVMLIITIPIQLHAVSLEMPGRNAPQPPVPPAIMQLEVDAGGRYVWNGEPLADRQALEARLREAVAPYSSADGLELPGLALVASARRGRSDLIDDVVNRD